jgi:hypothetical protein
MAWCRNRIVTTRRRRSEGRRRRCRRDRRGNCARRDPACRGRASRRACRTGTPGSSCRTCSGTCAGAFRSRGSAALSLSQYRDGCYRAQCQCNNQA